MGRNMREALENQNVECPIEVKLVPREKRASDKGVIQIVLSNLLKTEEYIAILVAPKGAGVVRHSHLIKEGVEQSEGYGAIAKGGELLESSDFIIAGENSPTGVTEHEIAVSKNGCTINLAYKKSQEKGAWDNCPNKTEKVLEDKRIEVQKVADTFVFNINETQIRVDGLGENVIVKIDENSSFSFYLSDLEYKERQESEHKVDKGQNK